MHYTVTCCTRFPSDLCGDPIHKDRAYIMFSRSSLRINMMESLHFHHSTFDTCLLPLEQVPDELWVTNTENHDDLFVPFRHREQDGPKYSLTNMTRNQLIAHHQSDVLNLDRYEATTRAHLIGHVGVQGACVVDMRAASVVDLGVAKAVHG